jgi:NADH-quinone oxidoreductase subunit C
MPEDNKETGEHGKSEPSVEKPRESEKPTERHPLPAGGADEVGQPATLEKQAEPTSTTAPESAETEKPAAAAPASPTAEKPPAALRPPAGEKPTPPKAAPAAPGAAKPPPAKKGPVITIDIAGDPLVDQIKERFADSIIEAVATLGQQIIRVKKESYLEICRLLYDGALFDMCTDLTAVHWPDRSGQEFEIVLFLYSVPNNHRIRIKTSVAEGESCPSVTPIWAGANWMEREVYDMFGVKFDGHPDLRRILLPEDWPGFPLRKEYPIEYRDNEWTDKHLQYREVEYDTSLIDVKYSERR